MDNEDNEFFILVAGVLAAIILVVSWWYMSGGVTLPVTQVAETPVAEPAAPVEEEVAEEPPPVEEEPEPEVVEEEPAPVEAPAAPVTLLDAMIENPDLSVVTSLLRDEGFSEALSATEGDALTVFAPSNDAVSDAGGSPTTVALLEADRAGVLSYHVVPGNYTLEQLTELASETGSATLTTLQGEPLSLSLDGDSLVINGNTVVTGDPREVPTGVIHTIGDVLVPPITALNTIVASEPILFASGSADIQAESFATLDQFTEVLSGSDVGVSIEGHTDSSGDPVLNQNLSQSRARSVLNYLVANGIEESRLSATGFGPSVPVADNETEEGRALNRRIEFTLNE